MQHIDALSTRECDRAVGAHADSRRHNSAYNAAPEPTAGDFEHAIASLNPRAAREEDGDVAGTPALLAPIARHQLLLAIGRGVTLREQPHAAQLVPKPSKFHAWLAGWRSAWLMCALAMVSDAALRAVMGRSLRPLPVPIIGLCPGRQPLEIAGCLSTALAKAAEWSQPLYVVSLDVAAAFDRMSRARAAEAFFEQGAHAAQISAVVSTTIGVRCCPWLGLVHRWSVPKVVGVRQGGHELPRCGNGSSLPWLSDCWPGGRLRMTRRWLGALSRLGEPPSHLGGQPVLAGQ